MSDDPETAARGFLTELEERLASKDLDRITDLFAKDVVLIGDGEENFDRAATVAYLGAMAEMAPIVRWEWEHVAVILSEPEVLSLAAAGTIRFDDESGRPLGDPEPFRVTGVLVEEEDRWRWRHFHGSRPRE